MNSVDNELLNPPEQHLTQEAYFTLIHQKVKHLIHLILKTIQQQMFEVTSVESVFDIITLNF